ncbi:PAS domain-containing hybrid sensor histidine kinase/response regulator [Coraliomargarita sp. W4R53]
MPQLSEQAIDSLRDLDEAKRSLRHLSRELSALKASESYHRTTFNSIGDAVMTTDASGRILKMNRVAEELTGWTEREAQGRNSSNVFNIIHTQTREIAESPVDRVLREGVVVGLANHTSLISKDGQEYQIADSGAPIINDDRKFIGVVLVFHDVTRHYENEAKIRKNEQFFTSILENSPFATWISNADGYVIRTNPALCQALNLTEDQIVGQYNALNDPNLIQSGVMDQVHQVFFENKIVRFELFWQPTLLSDLDFQEGLSRHINLIMYPILDDSGCLKNVVCQWTDITDVKETEMALEQSEMLFQMSQSMAKVGSWRLNIKENIFQWSKETYAIMGRDEQTYPLALETVGDIFYKDDAEIWEAHVRDSIHYTKPHYFEVRIVRPNGDVRQISVSGKVTRDFYGEPAMLSGIVRDVTEERKKEARLKMIFEATDNAYSGFNIIDQDCEFVYVNESYLRMWGYDSSEEVIATSPEDHCVDPEMPLRIIEMCQRTGRYEEVFQAKRKDGSHFTVLMNGGVSYDEHGRELYFAYSLDITERELNNSRLLHLTGVLRSVREVNQLITREKPDAATLIREATRILVSDRGYSYVSCALVDKQGNVADYTESSGFREYCRLSKSCEIGKPLPCYSLLQAKDHCAHYANNCDEVACGNTRQEIKTSHRFCGVLKYDKAIYGILTICMEQDVEATREELTLFKEMCKDLAFALNSIELEAQKKEAFEHMALAKSEAEVANRAKDEFLAVMSHELRTPLNPILGFTDLLRKGAPAKDLELLDIIYQSGERQLKLIEAILDYTRLDQGKLMENHSSFNLLEVCRFAFEGTRPMSEGLDFEFCNGGQQLTAIDDELIVIHDSEVLIRILSNLLQNACKYTDTGHVRLTIGQSSHTDEGLSEFQFIVEDSGIGISPQSLEQIFNAFTQVDSSCSRAHGGLGLGLAICSKLVDLSVGKIEVSSESGHGSTFTVTLPMKIKESRQTKLDNREPSVRPSGAEGLNQLRVLLVEDDAFNRLYFESLMRKFGLDYTLADGGYQAIAASQEKQFDVILMDLHMPDLSGFQTMDLIHADELNRLTPVYALTADNSVGMQEKCLAAGMVEVLTKPILPHKLQLILEGIAQR